MCASDDAEPMECYSNTTRKARKAHRCTECGREICRGEQFELVKGISDGYWAQFKTCAHCISARSWLNAWCRTFVLAAVREELVEHWTYGSEYRSVWLARAIVGMRRQWRTRKGALMQPLESYQRAAEAA
jgi:hypothetical protein